MAKLKAPLLSLGASGAIGKTMVFFGWKGLDCVREYVVPANPKTTAQNLQRGFLRDVVENIHEEESHATKPLNEVDKTAYSRYASTFPTPRTWFNQIAARWLIAKVNGEWPMIICDGTFTDPATTEITLTLANRDRPDIAASIYWGTSPTSMPNSQACDSAAEEHEAIMTGFTKGVKYFFQIRPDAVADAKHVMRSGIYTHVST